MGRARAGTTALCKISLRVARPGADYLYCSSRHDEPSPPPVPPLPAGIAQFKASSSSAHDAARHKGSQGPAQGRRSTEQTTQPTSSSPSADGKKDPSWRVIGGGVRVGTLTAAPDHSMASTTVEDGEAGHDVQASILVVDRSDEDAFVVTQPPRRSSVNDLGVGPQPRSPNAAVPALKLTLDAQVVTRKRSNSIPTTPSSLHVKTGNVSNAQIYSISQTDGLCLALQRRIARRPLISENGNDNPMPPC